MSSFVYCVDIKRPINPKGSTTIGSSLFPSDWLYAVTKL